MSVGGLGGVGGRTRGCLGIKECLGVLEVTGVQGVEGQGKTRKNITCGITCGIMCGGKG